MFLLLAHAWRSYQWSVILNKIIKFRFKFPKRIQVYFANTKELKLSVSYLRLPEQSFLTDFAPYIRSFTEMKSQSS